MLIFWDFSELKWGIACFQGKQVDDKQERTNILIVGGKSELVISNKCSLSHIKIQLAHLPFAEKRI